VSPADERAVVHASAEALRIILDAGRWPRDGRDLMTTILEFSKPRPPWWRRWWTR
jgi:hypothetical protein